MDSQQNQEKSISEQLGAALAQLTTDQLRFVVSRQEFSTDKEAAKAIGLKPDTVYHWPDVVRQAVELMAFDGVQTALHIRNRNLAKAMLIKAAGLDSDDERLRQVVATEFIEWGLGKAVQHTKLSGEIEVTTLTDDQRKARINAILEQAAKRE